MGECDPSVIGDSSFILNFSPISSISHRDCHIQSPSQNCAFWREKGGCHPSQLHVHDI